MAKPEELLPAILGQQDETAPNGAPRHDPQTWDPSIVDDNPRFGHLPHGEHVPLHQPEPGFRIETYLAEERAKDLLRFSTAGSVDDGKSTLIGRLLYDTQSVYDDQVRSIEGKGTTAPGVLDLALLTDGLRAEREQGITIDVAYRYFATPRRKFIIADTPGHEQYTRNMATGASTADVAIVLVDARKGVLRQSRRHAYITALLGVRHVIIAINKMDLVDWSERVFIDIRHAFTQFFLGLDLYRDDKAQAAALHFIPVSALAGDNVVTPSATMPWYSGPTLLALLEELPSSSHSDTAAPFRFAVQRITRPNLDFRGFAGQVAAGSIRPGDRVTALPSGQSSRIARIVTFDGDLPMATAPLSVTLTLEDEIDISRGDLLATSDTPAQLATLFTASLVWMDATPLETNRRYLLKHTSRSVQAQVRSLLQVANLEQLELSGSNAAEDSGAPAGSVADTLAINGIGLVSLETLQPLALDAYAANRHTGSFILIDAQTNATVAAGMIRAVDTPRASQPAARAQAVTAEERIARWGHTGAQITVTAADARIADALEHTLLNLGAVVLRGDFPHSVSHQIAQAGAIVLHAATHAVTDEAPRLSLAAATTNATYPLDCEPEVALRQALAHLQTAGVLRAKEQA